jgi:hypothetical protein
LLVIVTRREIADCVEEAFAHGPASREEIIVAAQAASARASVVTALERLPEVTFPSLRALWPHLPEMPIDV